MIVSILIGLTLILSTFISAVSIVQKMAYAQVRMEPSINGISVPNFMTQRSIVVGSNNEPGRNSAVQAVEGALSSAEPSQRATGVQGVAGALSSVHMTSVQHIPIGVFIGPAIRTIGLIGGLIFSYVSLKILVHGFSGLPTHH
jgi:hypothetical protein